MSREEDIFFPPVSAKTPFSPPEISIATHYLSGTGVISPQFVDESPFILQASTPFPEELSKMLKLHQKISNHLWQLTQIDGSLIIFFTPSDTIVFQPNTQFYQTINFGLVGRGNACFVGHDGLLGFDDHNVLRYMPNVLERLITEIPITERALKVFQHHDNSYVTFGSRNVQMFNPSNNTLTSIKISYIPMGLFTCVRIGNCRCFCSSETLLFGIKPNGFGVFGEDLNLIKSIKFSHVEQPLDISYIDDTVYALYDQCTLIKIMNVHSQPNYIEKVCIPAHHVVALTSSLCVVMNQFTAQVVSFDDHVSPREVRLSEIFSDLALDISLINSHVFLTMSNSGMFVLQTKPLSQLATQRHEVMKHLSDSLQAFKTDQSLGMQLMRNSGAKFDDFSAFDDYLTQQKMMDDHLSFTSMVAIDDDRHMMMFARNGEMIVYESIAPFSSTLPISTILQITEECHQHILDHQQIYHCKNSPLLAEPHFQNILDAALDDDKNAELYAKLVRAKFLTASDPESAIEYAFRLLELDIEAGEQIAIEFNIYPVLAQIIHGSQDFEKAEVFAGKCDIGCVEGITNAFVDQNRISDLLEISRIPIYTEIVGRTLSYDELALGIHHIIKTDPNYEEAASLLIQYVCISTNSFTVDQAASLYGMALMCQTLAGQDCSEIEGKLQALQLQKAAGFKDEVIPVSDLIRHFIIAKDLTVCIGLFVATANERTKEENTNLFAEIMGMTVDDAMSTTNEDNLGESPLGVLIKEGDAVQFWTDEVVNAMRSRGIDEKAIHILSKTFSCCK